MAILPILKVPDPRLKLKAEPVEKVDATLVRLMDDMLETMYAAPGIGLAAPQVGVAKRVIVLDIGEKEGGDPNPLRMANPQIVKASEEKSIAEEGCLSVPQQFADVERPARVTVRYLDEHNETKELEAEGLLAVVVQHEMDHLDGTLFIDYLSRIKRGIMVKKVQRLTADEEPVVA